MSFLAVTCDCTKISLYRAVVTLHQMLTRVLLGTLRTDHEVL